MFTLKEGNLAMLLLSICLFCLLSLGVYMLLIEPYRLHATHYFVRKEKQTVFDISDAADLYREKTSFTFAQISDLHFSRWYPPHRLNRVIRQLKKNKPDMVFFTGDLLDNYAKWPHTKTKKLVEALANIPAPVGKIAILGNHDYKGNGQYFVKEVLKQAGFTVLINNQVYFSNEQISLTVFGLDDAIAGHPEYTFEHTLAKWQILLTHEPDSIQNVPRLHAFDLVLAGHSHGGQIRLPFYRKRNRGARKYTDGLYLVTDKTLLAVNTGIGMTILPARLGVVPTVTYYHLEKEEPTIQLVAKNQ